MKIPFEFATVAAVVALVVWVIFVVRYHFTTGGGWRRYAEGWNIMSVSLSLIALIAYNLSTRIVRTEPVPLAYPGQGAVAFVVYVVLALAGVQRIVLQARAQRSVRDDVEV